MNFFFLVTILCYLYQHVGPEKASQTQRKAQRRCFVLLCPRYAQHQLQAGGIYSIGYARVGFALRMSISCCLSSFSLRWVPDAKAVSIGIWA